MERTSRKRCPPSAGSLSIDWGYNLLRDADPPQVDLGKSIDGRARPLPGGRFAVEWRPSTGAPTSGRLPFLKRRPASHDRLSAASVNGVIPRMARRPAPPPKPKSPTLTVGQTQRRIERLQKCVTKLEAFDPQKAHKRAPAVLELEATIDKALSSAFGYGTPAYLRYNEAATLDPSPLLAAARANTARPVGASPRQDVKVQETRQHFSDNRSRAIALIQQAIRTLEEEIAEAGSKVEKSNPSKPVAKATAEAPPKTTSPAKTELRAAAPRRWAGITLEGVRHRMGRWLKRK
jgi:hypothetical protein